MAVFQIHGWLPAYEEFVSEFGFPGVVKPKKGYGSLHLYLAKDRGEIEQCTSAIRARGWKPTIQKYLDGDEFTSGVTIDKTGKYAMS